MVKFLRDMIAIPSESCEEEGVVKRIAEEMKTLGYDKVEFDKLGNVIGWMGERRQDHRHRLPHRHRGHRQHRELGSRPLQGL